MRLKHTTHSLSSFPVYSSSFLSENEIVLGGGGGASKSGIKNKLRIYSIGDALNIELKGEFELERGEDAPMSMAAHLKDRNLICGINSTADKLEKGLNENCRLFAVKGGKLSLTNAVGTLKGGSLDDDFQKVTVLSPDSSMLAAAGSHSLQLFSYPSLSPIASPVTTEQEIYDATFSNDQLVIATTANLQIYSIASQESSPSSKKKKKGKSNTQPTGAGVLKLERTIDLPTSLGGKAGGSFRSARQSPSVPDVLYTVVNTAGTRTKSKSTPRQAYVCKWNTKTWSVEKTRKIGDRGLTCFAVSPDGKFLGYGSSDLSIGILDAQTLSSVSTILKAHDFPPTTIAFNPTSKLLSSGSADNSIRLVQLPEGSGKGPTFTVFIIAILIALIAFALLQLGLVEL